MAIGSDAEIGVTFGQLKDMSSDDISAWFNHMRKHWQPHLMNGYSTVAYPRGRGVNMMPDLRRVTDAAPEVVEEDVNLGQPAGTVEDEDDGDVDLGE